MTEISGAQLAGPVGGGFDGVDDIGAECSFFEGRQSGDRRSSGRSDPIPKDGRVVTGFQNHGCGAHDRLGGKLKCLFAGNPFEECSIGQGFNKGVNVGRATSGSSGDGIEQALLKQAGRADG